MSCVRNVGRILVLVTCLGPLLWVAAVTAAGQAQGQGDKPTNPAPQAKSSPAALTMYSDAASYQNRQAFELAADEWSRFLERFGSDPLAGKAQHYLGVCQMQLKRYTEAVAAFRTVIEKYPKSEDREEAYLNWGWCEYSLAGAGQGDLYADAAATFAKLIAEFPKSTYVDQALFFQADSYYLLGKKKEAAVAYGKLVMGHLESPLRPDGLYALGTTLEEVGEWAQANRAYDMFLEKYAKNDLATEIRMRKAETVLQQGDPAKAESLFAEVAAVEGFEHADHALLRQAFCTASQNKLAAAGALYAALAAKYPRSPYVLEAQLSAGRCLFRAEKYDEAARSLEPVAASDGDQAAEAAHWLAQIYLKRGAAADALALVDRITAKDTRSPFRTHLQLDRADALWEMEGRRSEALAEYVKVFKADPQHDLAPQALYYAAFAALELADFEQAVQLANQFLESFPKDSFAPDAQYVVAECMIHTKEYARAEEIYRSLGQVYKDHSQSESWSVRLGLVIYLQNNSQAAIDYFQPIVPRLRSAANKAESLFLIGACQFQLGQFAAAIGSLRASILADPQWRQADETLLYLAQAQHELGRWDEARATIATLQKSFPQSQLLGKSFYVLGESCFAAGAHPEAIQAFDQVISKWPDSSFRPFADHGKGWALLKTGEFDAAVKCFTHVIALNPLHQLHAESLFARGMCYRQMKDYAASTSDIDGYLASESKPSQRANALHERGLSEVGAKEYDKAAKTFSLLLAEFPDYPESDGVLYERAWAYKYLSQESDAVDSFATLIQKYPTSTWAAEAGFHVGEQHYLEKRYEEAVKAFGQAIAKTEDAVLLEKLLYKAGWAHFQLKQYDDAIVDFTRMLKDHADGALAADAWYMKGECLFQKKDYQQALAAYDASGQGEASSPQVAVLLQLHAGQSAAQLGQWQRSLECMDSIIKEFPETPFLAEAHFERGQAKLKLNQSGDAIQDFQKAAEGSRGVVGVRAQFMIGEIRFQRKEFDDAIKDFQRAMFRVVADDVSQEVGPWQAKAGYEAGRCCDVQIQNAESATVRAQRIADAKKFYRYVVDEHPESDLVEQANSRLKALAQL